MKKLQKESPEVAVESRILDFQIRNPLTGKPERMVLESCINDQGVVTSDIRPYEAIPKPTERFFQNFSEKDHRLGSLCH